MRPSADAVADFLLAVWATAQAFLWLCFGTPYILWHRAPIYCQTNYCYPTAGPFALLAVVLVIVIIWRLVALKRTVKSLVWTLTIFAFYISLPSIYSSLHVLERQAKQLEYGSR